MDAIFPGTFPFGKVKWTAKHDYEFTDNYKVLQQAFEKNGVKRHINVQVLSRAKYQDNLEMCQWMKSYFDKNYNGEPYDAVARRKNQDLTLILGGGKVAVPPKKSSGQPQMPTKASA